MQTGTQSNSSRCETAFKQVLTTALILLILSTAASAQPNVATLDSDMIEILRGVETDGPGFRPDAPSQHKFRDRQNRILFSVMASTIVTDFTVTHANLQNGGRELNPVTRVFSGSTASLAVNFAGEAVGTIGLSYYLHRTGHHRLERLLPVMESGASMAAVTYGLTHR
jgi:hypothetical protein